VILHGYERMTTNIDVVPEASRENLGRFRAALVKLDAEAAEQVSVDGGDNWVLRTKLGRIDVTQWVAGVESYAELRAVATHIPQIGATVWFAGFDDLIEMKRAAGRDQDLMDITALRMAHGLEE